MQPSGITLAPAPDSTVPSARSRAGRFAIWAVSIVVLAALAYFAYNYLHPAPSTSPEVSTAPAKVGAITAVVNSTGVITPWSEAKLSFQTNGQIAAIPVHVGDQVKKGDVVASLDVTQLRLQLEQAQANLASAQAKLEAVQAGPRAEDVAAAQAVRDAAQAKLDGMLAGGRAEDVKAAQATLASARAKLHELEQGAQSADIAAAASGVEQAQATLSKNQAALADLVRPVDPLVVQAAQLALDQAKTALWKDQTARDGVCGGSSPHYLCDAANAQLAADQTNVQQAQVKLQQAQEGAKPEDMAAAKQAVAGAQAQLKSAQAKLSQLQAGSLSDDIAQAQAAVDQAAQGVALKQQPFSEADIAQQRQIVQQADAQLALRKSPFTQADLDQANAGIAQAKAQVDLAQYNLDSAKLVAPFDGIVSDVTAHIGEPVSTIVTTPVVAVVNPTDLRLDVGVGETEVSRLQVGQAATVTFDAIPGKAFAGKVVAISPTATVESGVATYVVTIDLPDAAGVRPGMTGDAQIVYARHDNALLVPNRALRTDGGRQVVNVLNGSKVVATPVTVGVSDDQFTEIISGLQPGALVVVPVTVPSLPGAAGPSTATK